MHHNNAVCERRWSKLRWRWGTMLVWVSQMCSSKKAHGDNTKVYMSRIFQFCESSIIYTDHKNWEPLGAGWCVGEKAVGGARRRGFQWDLKRPCYEKYKVKLVFLLCFSSQSRCKIKRAGGEKAKLLRGFQGTGFESQFVDSRSLVFNLKPSGKASSLWIHDWSEEIKYMPNTYCINHFVLVLIFVQELE